MFENFRYQLVFHYTSINNQRCIIGIKDLQNKATFEAPVRLAVDDPFFLAKLSFLDQKVIKMLFESEKLRFH